jgi:hypothetical protein
MRRPPVPHPTRALRRSPAPPQDYGGHDSKFHSNVVVALHGQNCLGTAAFVSGHETVLYDNDCIVYGTERVDDLFENCNSNLGPGMAPVHGYNNRFYTAKANASATCDCCGLRPLAMLPAGLEDGFTASGLPTAAQIIAMGRLKLNLPAA